jgi:hypothetical protein
MADDLDERTSTRDSNWLFRLGLSLTALWVIVQLYYVVGVVGFEHFVAEGPPSVGGFLEGAFAPLAFLWLVIGFFLQREELQRSSRAIHLQYQEMRRTAELEIARCVGLPASSRSCLTEWAYQTANRSA